MNPYDIYIPKQNDVTFYECDPRQLNYVNLNKSTRNVTQTFTMQSVVIPFNGIGQFSVTSISPVTFNASRPAVNASLTVYYPQFCYNYIEEDVLLSLATPSTVSITYMIYNTD